MYRIGLSPRRAILAALTSAVPLIAATACVEPSVRPIVGPSGQAAFFISCPDSGQCYELAGHQCPQGYDIQRAQGTAIESYLVSCRQPGTAQARPYYPANASYTPAPNATATTPTYGWRQANPSSSTPQWAPPPPPPPPPAAEPTAETNVNEGPHGFRPIASDELDLGY